MICGEVDGVVARVESHSAGDHAVGFGVERLDGREFVGDAAVVVGFGPDDEAHNVFHGPVVEVVDEGDGGAGLICGEVDDDVEALGGGHLDVVVLLWLGEQAAVGADLHEPIWWWRVEA